MNDRTKIITELFLPFKEAYELKKLGFKDPTYGYYKDKNIKHPLFNMMYYDEDFEDLTRAPTYQQALKFFRENHGLNAYPVYTMLKKWNYITQKLDVYALLSGQTTLNICQSDTYEESELIAIKQLIKIVNKNETNSNR